MKRYSEILGKHPREIVLLQGRPCTWSKCTFCDYIHDNQSDDEAADRLNEQVLSFVSGKHKALEVINSGSVFELPPKTLTRIHSVVQQKHIELLSFECHWSYRERLDEIRTFFDIPILFKCGIETFDHEFRNKILKKGVMFEDPQQVREYFDSICIMVGIQGQTKDMIKRDIEILTSTFPRGCVNVYCSNSTPVKQDDELIHWFLETYSKQLTDHPDIDFLVQNTDFGVGGHENESK